MVKIEECDMIVPSHYVPWNFFSSNLASWLEEIPIRKLFFGCNNSNEKDFNDIKDYVSGFDKIEFIDQREIKTLGMQIADLMKRVKTEFFVYCHADAQPTRYSFLVIEAEMKDDVGIVESDRVQYDYDGKYDYPTIYPYYQFRERSFSGYQLFRMNAIKSILEKIEDDYIYRNEDIIFQNVCVNNGYKYIKSFAMHLHTCTHNSSRWTPQAEYTNEDEVKRKTFDMQIKGIVKYCTPDNLTKIAWRDAFGVCIQINNTNIFDFLDNFIKDDYPKWREAIIEIANERIAWGYR